MMSRNGWAQLFEDHPEALEMAPDEIHRRFWAYDPLTVALSRLRALLIRDVFAPVLNAFTRLITHPKGTPDEN